MTEIESGRVTLFPNIIATKNGDDFHLSDIMTAIQSGHWRNITEPLSQITAANERALYKKKYLPYFTGSGVFETRSASGLRAHNNRLILDFDKLDDPTATKQLIADDEFVEYAFISCSGAGLAVVVKIDGDRHGESFDALSEYFDKKYHLKSDPQCRDVSRARFVSYDPEMIHNPNAKVFLLKSKRTETAATADDPSANVREIIAGMIAGAVPGDRHNVFRNASRLAGGFVAGGLFDENEIIEFIKSHIARNSDDPAVHDKTVVDGINNGRLAPLSIADAKKMTDDNGDRAAWTEIYSFAHSVNRAGRAWTDVDVVHLCERFLINKDKVKAAFVKVFKENADEFGIDNKPEIARVELFIRKRWSIVRNVVTGITEFAETGSNEYEKLNINTIYRAIQYAGFKFSFEKLRSLLKSDYLVEYNPFVDYFNRLPTYDGEIDYIEELISHIKLKSTDSDDVRFFRDQFKKHLVRCIDCAINATENRFVFVLVGEKQATGKSTFIRFLNPFGRKYYTESPIRENKDTEISFSENFIWNLEELSSLGKIEINHLKSLISRAVIKERRPYAENADEFPRRVNFFGSTNNVEFLVDIQNSRWLCFDIDSISWSYKNKIDIANVWSQAFALYKTGFNSSLTADEQDRRDVQNKDFEINDVERDVVARFFKPATIDDANFKSTSEIVEILVGATENRIRLNAWNINKALKMLGFVQDRKYINGHRLRGYYVEKTANGGPDLDKLTGDSYQNGTLF